MKRLDPLLIIPPLLLSFLSLFTLWNGNRHLFYRQGVYLMLGLFIMFLIARINYRWWIRVAPLFYILGLGLLLGVLLFGHASHGSRAWLRFGSISLQPSELFKIILPLLLVILLQKRTEFRLPLYAAVCALPILFVLAQPDLGSAVSLIAICITGLVLSPLPTSTLFKGSIIFLLLASLSWFFLLKPYQKQRVLTFFYPERAPAMARYQVEQSLITIGSGQLAGKGIRDSSQSQLRFLPARYTDFIFAALSEQFGFIGVMTFFLLYLAFFLRILTVAEQHEGDEGTFLGILLFSFLLFHVGYNTAMNAAMLPNTGIPLPFLSYGGSFLLVCWMSVGLFLNLSAGRFGAQ